MVVAAAFLVDLALVAAVTWLWSALAVAEARNFPSFWWVTAICAVLAPAVPVSTALVARAATRRLAGAGIQRFLHIAVSCLVAALVAAGASILILVVALLAAVAGGHGYLM
jgi:hypothetical protein